MFRVRALTSSGSTGGRGRGHSGGDAKTIISPNTSFGDIIKQIPSKDLVYHGKQFVCVSCKFKHDSIITGGNHMINGQTRTLYRIAVAKRFAFISYMCEPRL